MKRIQGNLIRDLSEVEPDPAVLLDSLQAEAVERKHRKE